MAAHDFDLAVIGGGPAGAATAYYAARAGLRVCLLERAAFPRDKVCGDGLTARAIAVLQDMGLGAAVGACAAHIERCAVRAPLAAIDLPISAAPGFPAYAWVLPRLQLDELLARRAASAGAELRERTEVLGARDDDDGVVLETSSAQLRARLAVLACGAHLKLPRRLGLIAAKPRTMVAARAYVRRAAQAPQAWHVDFCRIAAPGYGWVFPVSTGLANAGVGFFHAQHGRAPAAALQRYLALPATRRALGGEPGTARIESFPLRTDFLRTRLAAGRVWAAGEAAGLVNPVTGEGIDYALESGRIAALQAVAALGAAPAADEAAARYASALHAQFGRSFQFAEALLPWCSRPSAVGALAWLSRLRPRLRRRLVEIVLGGGIPGREPRARELAFALLRDRR